ncbi:MAG: Ig-like domain-containing protein, partial [Clostridia bacterium]
MARIWKIVFGLALIFTFIPWNGAMAASDIKQVAAGLYHNLVLKEDGTVWAWGGNSSGQLGDGTTGTQTIPVQVKGLADVIAIAAGDNHSLALKSDGTVWTWGHNQYGKLGDGTSFNQTAPVQVKGPNGTGFLTGVIAIDGSANHSVALKSDGTVWAWGYNYNGQLGDGTITTRLYPVQVKNLTGVKAIAAGDSHTIVLKEDSTVWAWGYNSYNQLGDSTNTERHDPVQVKDPNNVTQPFSGVTSITAAGNSSFALQTNGEAWGWGYNGSGQLGDGTTTNRSVPVQVKDPIDNTKQLKDVKKIQLSSSHVAAMKNDGTLWTWGLNAWGQLGIGSKGTNKLIPVQVVGPEGNGSFSDAAAVAAGYSHTTAVKQDGTIWTWGSNQSGQLGNGTTSSVETLVPMQVKKVVLNNLVLSAGTLSPAFSPMIGSYTMAVSGVNSITITPTASDASATITVSKFATIAPSVNGFAPVTIPSGTTSAPIPLTPGINELGIRVTSADGVSMSQYSVTITRDNQLPVPTNTEERTAKDTPVKGTLWATDFDNDPLEYSIVTNGANGTAVVSNTLTGAYTYTPNPGFIGQDSFTFKAHDGGGYNIGKVTITVVDNHPPVVQNPIGDLALTVGESKVIDLSNVFSDPDNGGLSLS